MVLLTGFLYAARTTTSKSSDLAFAHSHGIWVESIFTVLIQGKERNPKVLGKRSWQVGSKMEIQEIQRAENGVD
jgi:hypothetical protein